MIILILNRIGSGILVNFAIMFRMDLDGKILNWFRAGIE